MHFYAQTVISGSWMQSLHANVHWLIHFRLEVDWSLEARSQFVGHDLTCRD